MSAIALRFLQLRLRLLRLRLRLLRLLRLRAFHAYRVPLRVPLRVPATPPTLYADMARATLDRIGPVGVAKPTARPLRECM